jgi:hypothetical protein
MQDTPVQTRRAPWLAPSSCLTCGAGTAFFTILVFRICGCRWLRSGNLVRAEKNMFQLNDLTFLARRGGTVDWQFFPTYSGVERIQTKPHYR